MFSCNRWFMKWRCLQDDNPGRLWSSVWASCSTASATITSHSAGRLALDELLWMSVIIIKMIIDDRRCSGWVDFEVQLPTPWQFRMRDLSGWFLCFILVVFPFYQKGWFFNSITGFCSMKLVSLLSKILFQIPRLSVHQPIWKITQRHSFTPARNSLCTISINNS